MQRLILYPIALVLLPVFLLISFLAGINRKKNTSPKVLLGFDPIINIKYWSKAIQAGGLESKTHVFGLYHINKESDFDFIYQPKNKYHNAYCRVRTFILILFNYDIWVFSFNGGPLGCWPILKSFEPYFLKLAKIKSIVWPYGSDAYVYKNIRDVSVLTALQISYPMAARRQNEIGKNICRWTKHADIILPGFMACEGIGRFDIIIPNFLTIDQKKIAVNLRNYNTNKPIVVAHSSNHRGVKGTEYIINAVEQLQSEGFNVELLLFEKMMNDEVLRLLSESADILVEQLIIPGHGLSAIEGMACGLPVISNFDNEEYIKYYRRYSYLNECPIISATPENITCTLRDLINDKKLMISLGDAGRNYVEKYHSLEAGSYMFKNIIDKIWYDKNIDLMNLYHPIIGEYPKLTPLVEHPLINNIIPIKNES